MAKDVYAKEQHQLEKAIQKVLAAIAELGELRDAPMWPSQIDLLKKAIFDLEDRMSDDRGVVNQLIKNPTNR